MRKLLLAVTLFCSACYQTPEKAPPASFTTAELVPDRPTDTTKPLAAVIWALNYDLRQFETVWSWLHSEVPAGAERSRALGAAGLIAVAELDQYDRLDEAVAAFDEAIPQLPDDARLPCWRAYLVYLKARHSGDADAVRASFDGLREAAKTHPAFTEFGVTLAVAGWADAPQDLLDEGRAAFDKVLSATNDLAVSSAPLDRDRLRRIFDTPIAPYNVPAMQAMIGDLAVRAGKKDEAGRGYYTALHSNNAYRWPWRKEVERRMKGVDALATGLAARPATETMLGSEGLDALGVSSKVSDPRFSGRIGNGSCTVCHTHVSVFDLGEQADQVGWVRGKMKKIDGADAYPTSFVLPKGDDAIPGGFGIGPFVDATAPRDFDAQDSMFDGTFIAPAAPGTYFVAIQADIKGQAYQGYSAREFGQQWWFEVKAGEVTEIPGEIEMKVKK